MSPRESYAALAALVDGLDVRSGGGDLARPTRAEGWTVRDLLLHHLLDAQRALVALATPADRPPDVDAVTYWRGFGAGDPGAASHAEFVRTVAGAHHDPSALVAQWRETTDAAVRAWEAAHPSSVVATQGHALTVADLGSTLVVEATIHHLDLGVDLPSSTPPSQAGLVEVRRVLDGLLGTPVAAAWDHTTYALKGTGRLPLTPDDRHVLGSRADAFPLLG